MATAPRFSWIKLAARVGDNGEGGTGWQRFGTRRRAHLRRGARGERAAARALVELGLVVLCRNYRTRRGEIDLVARDGTTLCFIEVKTRRRPFRGRPGDAVGHAKKARIVRAGARYLREIHRPPVVYRYDVVEVIIDGRRIADVRYWPAAFAEEERR